MKIMRFAAGFGNTMFQYATFLQLKKLYPNEEILVDTLWYDYTGYPFELDQVFPLDFSDINFYSRFREKYKVDFAAELKALDFWHPYYDTWNECCNAHPGQNLNYMELPRLYQSYIPSLRIVNQCQTSIEQMRRMLAGGPSVEEQRKAESAPPGMGLRLKMAGASAIRKISPGAWRMYCVLRRKGARDRLLRQLSHGKIPDLDMSPGLERLKNQSGDVYFNIYGNINDLEGVRSQLLRDFRFPALDGENARVAALMDAGESVCVHARVTSFAYGMSGLAENDYFRKALDYVRRKAAGKGRLRYFVFSDDAAWSRAHPEALGLDGTEEAVFISGNTGKNSYRDMQLMSHCKYFILPHSSFSWWGSYLSPREGKIVVVPKGPDGWPGTKAF